MELYEPTGIIYAPAMRDRDYLPAYVVSIAQGQIAAVLPSHKR